MQHKPEAVEKMARYLFNHPRLGHAYWYDELTEDERSEFVNIAVAVLDAMVPKGWDQETLEDHLIGIADPDCYGELGERATDILNGTANLGGDDGKN